MNKEKDLQAIDLKRAARWGFAGRVVMNIYAIIASIGCLYPMIWLVYSSLKTQFEFDVDSFSLPAAPTLDNYVHVLSTTPMFRYMLNSIIVSVVSVSGIILFSFIVGYFVARMKF